MPWLGAGVVILKMRLGIVEISGRIFFVAMVFGDCGCGFSESIPKKCNSRRFFGMG